jgi:putative transcriptional regulator
MDFINYGEVKLDIKTAMEKYGKTKSYVKRVCYLDSRAMNRYYDGSITRIDIEVLARLCFAIGCSLDEILSYEEPKDIFPNRK